MEDIRFASPAPIQQTFSPLKIIHAARYGCSKWTMNSVIEDFIAVAEKISEQDLMGSFDNRLYSKEGPDLSEFR